MILRPEEMNTKPEAIKKTLQWCNVRRKTQGKKPLRKLPKGKRGNPESCPCGKATGLRVHYYTWQCQDGKPHQLPLQVRRFVSLFDDGHIPEYDLLHSND